MSPTTLSSLPVDTLHEIFQYLDDCEILPLCTVCKTLRIVALVSLLVRNCTNINVEPRDKTKFSSYHLSELEESLKAITKLTSSVKYSNLLTAIISALPNLIEVDLTPPIRLEDYEELERPGRVPSRASKLVCALLGHKNISRPLLIIKHDVVCISKRRRLLSINSLPLLSRLLCSDTNEPVHGRPAWICHFPIPIVEILVNFARVPLFHGRQGIRIDMTRSHANGCSIQLRSNLSIPSFRDWALVILDGVRTTKFVIGSKNKLGGSWSPLLQFMHFPSLQSLRVDRGAELEYSDFVGFLTRHRTITALSLNHFTLSKYPLHPKWPTGALLLIKHLELPLHYAELMFGFTKLRVLCSISIGNEPIPDTVNPMEREFDFIMLDTILWTLAGFKIQHLTLTIPGGLASKDWLGGGVHKQIVQRLAHVTTVVVYAEYEEPFHRDFLHLLFTGHWFALFPAGTRRDGISYTVKHSGCLVATWTSKYPSGGHVIPNPASGSCLKPTKYIHCRC